MPPVPVDTTVDSPTEAEAPSRPFPSPLPSSVQVHDPRIRNKPMNNGGVSSQPEKGAGTGTPTPASSSSPPWWDPEDPCWEKEPVPIVTRLGGGGGPKSTTPRLIETAGNDWDSRNGKSSVNVDTKNSKNTDSNGSSTSRSPDFGKREERSADVKDNSERKKNSDEGGWYEDAGAGGGKEEGEIVEKVEKEAVTVEDKPKTIPDAELWSTTAIEKFFSNHGYANEVEYVKGVDLDMSKVANSDSLSPMTTFSMKMGLRTLELIRTLRKLADAAPAPGSRSSFGSNSFSFGGGNDDSSQGFGSGSRDGGRGRGRGGGRGGGGGDRACFKCGEVGHISRECPTGGGGGGSFGGGGGGGPRTCFKCGETGHMSRECPTGGGGGGQGGGNRNRSFGNSGGDTSGWGGGSRPSSNDGWGDSGRKSGGGGSWGDSGRKSGGGGGDSWGAGAASKKVDDEDWDDVGKTKTSGNDAWGATGGKRAKVDNDNWDDAPAPSAKRPRQSFGNNFPSTSAPPPPPPADEESWD